MQPINPTTHLPPELYKPTAHVVSDDTVLPAGHEYPAGHGPEHVADGAPAVTP